jgi:hypothetical protein
VDRGRRLGLLLFIEVWEPVVQPGQFGVGRLPDVCAHRCDDGCRGRLFLPVGVCDGLGVDNGVDLGDLVRYCLVCQLPPECGDVDEGDPGQATHGGVDLARHSQVEYEQRGRGRPERRR